MLELRNISYSNGEFRLGEINMKAVPGRMLAIAGPNGSGKSTLLKIACGHLRPERGEVIVGGKNITGLGNRERSREISYLPQELPRPFSFTVLDVMRTARIYMDQDEERLIESLDICGASHLKNRIFENLSGGEKRIVMISSLVYRGGRILMLDEPTSFLDIEKEIRILKILRNLKKEGYTIIVSIHDMSFLSREADDILLIKNGRPVAFGPRNDVLNSGNLEKTFGITFARTPGKNTGFIPEFYVED